MKQLNSIRRYDPLIPSFLTNRPKLFLKHCLSRIPPQSPQIPQSHISRASDGTFKVISIDSDNTYKVELCSQHSPDFPSCECFDWIKHHLPCKHLLAVLLYVPEANGWDGLPAAYVAHPCFNLDPDILSASTTSSASEQQSTLDVQIQDPRETDMVSSTILDDLNLDSSNMHCSPNPEKVSLDTTTVQADTDQHLKNVSSGKLLSLEKLQAQVRQVLAAVNHCTYNIEDSVFLEDECRNYEVPG